MPTIINKLPFSTRDSTVTVRGQSVVVKRHQIIVWVSLAELGFSTLHPETPHFPALLDTGCNHNLIIPEQLLREWAGIHPQYLPRAQDTRLFGEHVPQFAANIWLHANELRERDRFANRPPFLLEAYPGIVVLPQTSRTRLRLPLLGIRALERAKLHMTIDFERHQVSVRTPRKYWFFF